MENTFSIEGLWAYIQSLSLSRSNKDWLIARLREPQAKSVDTVDAVVPFTREDLVREVRESNEDYESGNYTEASAFVDELKDYINSL